MRKLLVTALMAVCSIITFAQARNVFIGTNGAWNSSGNWSLGRAPQSGDIVEIPAGKNVSLGSSRNFSPLTLEVHGILELGIRTLTINGAASNIHVLGNGRITSFNLIFLFGMIVMDGTIKLLGNTVSGPAYANNSTGWGFASGALLPVTLSNFQLNARSAAIRLEWQTELEVNSDKIIIERSDDGLTWKQIGSVKAQGNSEVIVQYSFDDGAPITGINYYRLKLLDADASFKYSPVKLVRFGEEKFSVELFPNPAVNSLRIHVNRKLHKDEMSLLILNQMGQVLAQEKLAANETFAEINVKRFVAGKYYIQVSSKSGFRESRAFIVVK